MLEKNLPFSNLRIEIEECLQTGLQLFFNLILTAFEQVHGDMRLTPILELQGRVAYLCNLLGRQQSQSINQRQFCHGLILPSEKASHHGDTESTSEFLRGSVAPW